MKTQKQILAMLVEIIQSIEKEVDSFRALESRKAGCDIGWERAAEEWMTNHFPAWKRRHWQAAIQQALREPALLDELPESATTDQMVMLV